MKLANCTKCPKLMHNEAYDELTKGGGEYNE